ncbi:MAG TPA: acyltransferase [Caulobacteraceae bacterium]|nr:acyltransferase [Caulobacteraceae bacterium]
MAGLTRDLRSLRAQLAMTPEPPPPPSPPGEIRSLNTIRGVAALMVAIFHAPALFGVAETFPHAYLAVDLFFVLSGFVLLHAYDARIEHGLSLPRFFQLRLARLYPLLLVVTFVGFGVMLIKHAAGRVPMNGDTFLSLPLSLFMLPAPADATINHAAFPFVSQSWSIVWEVALCPILFVWVKWVRTWAVLIAAVFALALAWVAFSQGTIDGGWTTPTFWVGALRAIVAFFAGVSMRIWTRMGPLPRWANRAAAAAAVLVVGYVTLVHGTFWWAEFAAAVAGFPLIIAAAAQRRHRLLENWVGDRIGEASYSIYMLHAATIDVLETGLKRVSHISAPVHFALGLGWVLALIVGAWFCWRYVETPLRRHFSRTDMPRPRLFAPHALARA